MAGMASTADPTCVAGVNTNTMNMAGASCVECVCTMDPMSHTKCDANCWGLIQCIGSMCAGNSTDIICIGTMCSMFTGETAMATAFGPTVMACPTQCM
jgi:hypothetical protein